MIATVLFEFGLFYFKYWLIGIELDLVIHTIVISRRISKLLLTLI